MSLSGFDSTGDILCIEYSLLRLRYTDGVEHKPEDVCVILRRELRSSVHPEAFDLLVAQVV